MKSWSELDGIVREIEKEYLKDIYKTRNLYTIDEVYFAINQLFDVLDGEFICANNSEKRILSLFLSERNREKEYKEGEGKPKRIRYIVVSRPTKGSSLLSRESIRYYVSYCFSFFTGKNIVNLNEEFRKRGFQAEGFWWEMCALSYKEINKDMRQYLELSEAGVTNESMKMAMRVFGDYFYIRDFYSAKKWLDIILNNPEDSKEKRELQDIWKRVDGAFEQARQDIRKREHIVVNWVDGLRYDELNNMTHLKSLVNEGIFFENMYAPTDYTHAVEKAIFCERLQIDDHSWEIKETDFDKHILERKLKKYGYKTISASHYMMHNLNLDYPEVVLWHYIYSSLANAKAVPSALLMYYGVCRLQAENKAFCIGHYLSEIHPPRVSPDYPNELNIKFVTEQEKEHYMEQVMGSERYLDDLIGFYSRFFLEAKYNIYMSDHGQVRTEKDFTVLGKHHVIFSILGKDVKPKRVKRAESLLHFSELLDYLLEDNPNAIDDDKMAGYVAIQRDDSYGCDFNFDVLGNECSNRLYAFIQYRGIVTEKDSFTRFVTGQEYYYTHESEKNLIDHPDYQERIAKLREITGKTFIDINKEDRYKTTRDFYKQHGIKRAIDNLYN